MLDVGGSCERCSRSTAAVLAVLWRRRDPGGLGGSLHGHGHARRRPDADVQRQRPAGHAALAAEPADRRASIVSETIDVHAATSRRVDDARPPRRPAAPTTTSSSSARDHDRRARPQPRLHASQTDDRRPSTDAAAAELVASREKSSSHGQPQTERQAKKATRAPSRAHKQADAPKLPTGKGVPSATNPTYSLSLPGPGADRRPQLLHRLLPDPAVPDPDLPGGRDRVPGAVAGAGGDQRDRDRLRPQPLGLLRRRRRLDAVPALDLEAVGRRRQRRRVADPYNPVDAIFTAARYLHAAGASKNLSQAIFAYNHAGWYVQSVLLRAQADRRHPVAADRRAHRPGRRATSRSPRRPSTPTTRSSRWPSTRSRAPTRRSPIDSDPNSKGTSIFAKQGSPVIAVNDGKIVKIGSQPGARALHQAPGLDRQHLHLRAARLGVEDLSGAQAGQDHRRATSPRSWRRRRSRRPSRAGVGRSQQATDRRPRRHQADRRRPPARRPRPAARIQRRPAKPPTTPRDASPRRWSRSGCSPTRRARPPTPPAASCSSRTPASRSRASRTTSPTRCTWARTSTRSSRSRPARSSSPARSSAGSAARPRACPRTCTS